MVPNLPLALLQYKSYGRVSHLLIGLGRGTAGPSPRICHVITQHCRNRTAYSSTAYARLNHRPSETDSLGPGNETPRKKGPAVPAYCPRR
ncbi:hypothetical protein F5X98DRAFT_358051 [Xylaria grammica]|nr:hypothetical protein F5X98DRAFT_358051 [Xylaria grammica]